MGVEDEVADESPEVKAAWNPIGDPNMEMGVNGIEAKLSLEFSDM
jgi:hypothetical protein